MKKLSLLLIPLLLMSLLIGSIGCGGDDEDETTPVPTATEAPDTATPIATETQATATPAVTQEPQPTPTAEPLGSPPCRFRGTVMLDGATVADGIEITAIINGDEYTTETPSDYGASTYVLLIEASYDAGTEITFKIGNRIADQTGSWEMGGNIELNLSAG